jgi:hypothetical protein
MSLEQNSDHHNREVVDKYVNPNADYQMATYDYVVRPSADGDSGPINLTLPPVAEAKGRFYGIVARNADGTNFIIVQDKDDSECWAGDITLNGKCDRVLLYSDGLTWYTVLSVLTFTGTTLAPTTSAPQ